MKIKYLPHRDRYLKKTVMSGIETTTSKDEKKRVLFYSFMVLSGVTCCSQPKLKTTFKKDTKSEFRKDNITEIVIQY